MASGVAGRLLSAHGARVHVQTPRNCFGSLHPPFSLSLLPVVYVCARVYARLCLQRSELRITLAQSLVAGASECGRQQSTLRHGIARGVQ